MRVLPQGLAKGACKESKHLTLVPKTCMRKVVLVNEYCILGEGWKPGKEKALDRALEKHSCI